MILELWVGVRGLFAGFESDRFVGGWPPLLSKLSGKGAGRPSAGVGEAVEGELAAALDPVSLGVDVWVRDHGFEVTGDATVDDPPPTPSGSGNQRTLRDLPSVVTPDLDECIAVLTRYTAELCAYTSVG